MMPSQKIFSLSASSIDYFVEHAPCGVLFLSDSGEIIYANEKIKTMTGCDTESMTGSTLTDFIVNGESGEIERFFLVSEKKEIVSSKKLEIKMKALNGLELSAELSYHVIREGKEKFIFCTIVDISQQIELQNKLYHQAITDPLTNLYNRRYFDETLTQEFQRANRYRRPFSTVIIDIDGFKYANDLHGHSFGDDMLIRATSVFEDILRDGDTVYRYGGDEFAMILPETSKEGSVEVADRLRQKFLKKCSIKAKRVKLSLSIGVASYPEDGMDQKSLIGAADNRMFYAKESGGNKVVAYDPLANVASGTEAMLRTLAKMAHLMEKKRGFVSAESGINHSQSIRALSVELGHRLGLNINELAVLEQAATLHDIGTISIPSSIWNKKQALTESDWQTIKNHTLAGEEIIEMVADHRENDLAELKKIIGQHHERLDGSGYPRGLIGEEILMGAKILAVTDTYTSMLSERPYRKAITKKQALEKMQAMSGIQLEAEVISKLFELEKVA
ncbi:MAG: diguanylate cyclase [Gammaproteobacteria bacterium]|nr:diguanylate cyclase [Gammaproteobacteria bacterium]